MTKKEQILVRKVRDELKRRQDDCSLLFRRDVVAELVKIIDEQQAEFVRMENAWRGECAKLQKSLAGQVKR